MAGKGSKKAGSKKVSSLSAKGTKSAGSVKGGMRKLAGTNTKTVCESTRACCD